MNNDIQNKQFLINDNIGRKILEAAVNIVTNEGYANLTIRKVAKESECSNSAIYMRFEDKDALARAVASLHAKPLLIAMDENYIKEQDFLTNYNRITKLMLKKIALFDSEAIHMQIKYNAALSIKENPFVLRVSNYIKHAVSKGEVSINNAEETAYIFNASFWGVMEMLASKVSRDISEEEKLLVLQNSILYNGIKCASNTEDSLWDILKENGVSVDKALERMNGNKDAYRSFLVEFFEDFDFENLKTEIVAQNAKSAFEYAHGLKGMAANLGLDSVHSKLSVLVEILRQGSLDNTQETYDEVMQSCKIITTILCNYKKC